MKMRTITIMTALLLGVTPLVMAEKAGAPGGRAGGMSADHMSRTGQDNTNAQHQEGASRGLDRAEERMSEEGLEHSQGEVNSGKDKANKKQESRKKKASERKTKN